MYFHTFASQGDTTPKFKNKCLNQLLKKLSRQEVTSPTLNATSYFSHSVSKTIFLQGGSNVSRTQTVFLRWSLQKSLFVLNCCCRFSKQKLFVSLTFLLRKSGKSYFPKPILITYLYKLKLVKKTKFKEQRTNNKKDKIYFLAL